MNVCFLVTCVIPVKIVYLVRWFAICRSFQFVIDVSLYQYFKKWYFPLFFRFHGELDVFEDGADYFTCLFNDQIPEILDQAKEILEANWIA